MTIKINHALVIDGYCTCSPSLISFKTDDSLCFRSWVLLCIEWALGHRLTFKTWDIKSIADGFQFAQFFCQTFYSPSPKIFTAILFYYAVVHTYVHTSVHSVIIVPCLANFGILTFQICKNPQKIILILSCANTYGHKTIMVRKYIHD